MTDSTRRGHDRPPPRRRRLRVRLTTLLGLVVICALGLAAYVRYRESRAPWERAGGMIGWSQAAIESRLGAPVEVIEGDAPDEHAQKIRPRPPGGRYRTCVYRAFEGHFVAWLRDGGRGYDCLGSSWIEKRRYY